MLLGSTGAKAVRKYVGEIEPRFLDPIEQKGGREEEEVRADAKMEKIFKNFEKTVQGQKLTLSHPLALSLSLSHTHFSSLTLLTSHTLFLSCSD